MNIELLPIEAITQQLIAMIGYKLTAYIGKAHDVQEVSRWATGKEVNSDIAKRLRFTHQLVSLLSQEESLPVIQSWLTGLNPDLSNQQPLKLIRESNLQQVGPQIIKAARIFLIEG